MIEKPRIKLSKVLGISMWQCFGHGETGYAFNPCGAYQKWKKLLIYNGKALAGDFKK